MNNETQTDTKQEGEKIPQPIDKPLSIVDEAIKVRDEIKAENDRRENILKEEQKLKVDGMLAGTSGGHVEAELVPEEEQKKKRAAEFFKGTELETAINKS